MPLHAPTVPALPFLRPTRVAAVAAVCCAAAAATVVIADDQPAPQVPSIVWPTQREATSRLDIETVKPATMRALGRHLAQQGANRTSPHPGIEANEARLHRAR